MSLSCRRQWPARTRQKALLEFASLKHTCPPGIHISLTSGNPSIWSGVFFARNGPYAPAILRFEVAFPSEYPRLPPLIVFKSDIFHPLVTPLTTYTYLAGSSGSHAVGDSEYEQLPPGGFSLKHAFPDWYGHTAPGIATPPSEDTLSTSSVRDSELECDSDEHRNVDPAQNPRALYDIAVDAGKPPGPGQRREVPTMAEILYYMKSSFEDEVLLDNLPSKSAVCSGAWHAWLAYRGKAEQHSSSVKQDGFIERQVSRHQDSATVINSAKPVSHWNWDGVWVKRVRTGVDLSISEPVLYANDGDDPIHFLDVDDIEMQSIRNQFNSIRHG
ncbi:hypothetical protein MMC11_001199 [Xylographa trunciseda]|nr:hypothetical protein [Xylographa trunciseda]